VRHTTARSLGPLVIAVTHASRITHPVKMYREVVIPLDGSELAEDVLPHVAQLIRGRDSRVYLLSVTPMMRGVTPPFVDLRPKGKERRRVEQELREYLRTAARRLEPVATDVQIIVRFGRPADEILALVNEVGADLIAMSTYGRSGISHWVFGSVADRVLRGAACPVLLVRAGQAQLRTTYQRILVPLDGSELAEQVLPHVKTLIRPPLSLEPVSDRSPGGLRGSTRVFLISVLTTRPEERAIALLTSYPAGLQLATTALHHTEIQLRFYLRSVATTLREQGVAVYTAVQRGSPAKEILAYAAEVDADLISMTTHGFSGASQRVYGNVAGKVLQGACSPVLLVRPIF